MVEAAGIEPAAAAKRGRVFERLLEADGIWGYQKLTYFVIRAILRT